MAFLKPSTLTTARNSKKQKKKYFCQKHGIKQVHGAPRTPQTQGLVERNNRTVKEKLSNILKEIQADHSSWCSKLGEAAYKKNITIHRVVRETPYRLVFGIDPKKEIQMKVTVDDETKLSEEEEHEKDQEPQTANATKGMKQKSSSTCEAQSRKKMRSEANSHQMDEKMKNSRPKAKTLNIGDYVSIKIDKVDKTPLHPNVLIREIVAFENDYAKVACKFGIISTLISPVRLVKCEATNIHVVTSKDKNITFTKACKLAMNQ